MQLSKIMKIYSNTEIDDFYISCMACGNTVNECPGIQKDYTKGIPPRGFFYKTSPVDILVVGKNPGHTLKGESANYINKSGRELFESYRQHQNSYYSNPDTCPERSNIFHKNLFRYISYFLDIDQTIDSIYSRIAHTNLVKCSTLDETGRLCKDTIEQCFHKFFLNELQLFKPKIILALGREVERFLNRKITDIPIIYIKHPSYHYRIEDEAEILRRLKFQILALL